MPFNLKLNWVFGWRWIFAFSVLHAVMWCPLPAATVKPAPNIVLILADDLGARDLDCYGSDFHETPHIDRLAKQGVRFINAYAPAPVCSPTRAAIMTGKHPARLNITIWSEGSLRSTDSERMLQAKSLHDLPLAEITLAEHFQTSGYLTAAIGKWHLGGASNFPEAQGFDINIGGTHWGAPHSYFFPYRGTGRFGAEFRYVPHLEFGEPGEYLTDRLTLEATRVIDAAAVAKRPFFVYLAHHAPHTPIEAKAVDVAHFQAKVRPGLTHHNPVYAGMLKSLDESVGRIADHLALRDLAQNTIVIFSSDNGGYIGTDRRQTMPATSNAPLRSGKGTLYEGGIRVPLIVRWPGTAPADQTREQAVVLTDLFRTLLAAANFANPNREAIPEDGIDLTQVLLSANTKLNRREMYFHYPHYYNAPRSTPASAIRLDEWKLIEFFEDKHVELYNLLNDPYERMDESQREPNLTSQLKSKLADWRSSVGAQLPMHNPNFRK